MNPEICPPENVISELSKSFTVSEVKKVNCTELSFVNKPPSTSEEEIEIVGEVPS